MPLFAPLNSSAAFKRSDGIRVRASIVSTPARAGFSHTPHFPCSIKLFTLPIPILLDCLPFPHPSILHVSGQALPSPSPSHSRGRAFPHVLSARAFRTHHLRTLPHANFHNARLIGLSLRLSNKLFRVNFHSTSRDSLRSKLKRANAAQTMSRFC